MKLLFFIFFFVSVSSFCQDTTSVRCIVTDLSKEPIESASVLLFRIGETVPLDTFTTNSKGTCRFPVFIDSNGYKLLVKKEGLYTSPNVIKFLAESQQTILLEISLVTITCTMGKFKNLSFKENSAEILMEDDPSWIIDMLKEYPNMCMTATYIYDRDEPKKLYRKRASSYKNYLKNNNIKQSRVKYRSQLIQKYNSCSGCFEAQVASMEGCN